MISMTIGESLQQKMLKNQWKMKGFSEYGRAAVTRNAQKPMGKHDFSQGGRYLAPHPHASVGEKVAMSPWPPLLTYYCTSLESLGDRDREDPRSRGPVGNPGYERSGSQNKGSLPLNTCRDLARSTAGGVGGQWPWQANETPPFRHATAWRNRGRYGDHF